MSVLEGKFKLFWRALGGHSIKLEHKFHPYRKWRFDFAHIETKVAIEVEGGHWSGGRHVRGTGFEADCEKYMEATLLGWTVFRLTGKMITTKTLERIINYIDNKQKPHDMDYIGLRKTR